MNILATTAIVLICSTAAMAQENHLFDKDSSANSVFNTTTIGNTDPTFQIVDANQRPVLVINMKDRTITAPPDVNVDETAKKVINAMRVHLAQLPCR